MGRGRRAATLYGALLLVITWPSHGVRAEVVRARIERREPFADGNESAGIRLPAVAVPLGTYTGWNLRSAEHGAEGALAGLHGSSLIFPATRAERVETRDPRASIAERYPTREIYLARVTVVVLRLLHDRFLLPDDALKILRDAAQWKPIARQGR